MSPSCFRVIPVFILPFVTHYANFSYENCENHNMSISPPSSDSYLEYKQTQSANSTRPLQSNLIGIRWMTRLSRPSGFRMSLERPPKDPLREASNMGCGRGTGGDETHPSARCTEGRRSKEVFLDSTIFSIASSDSPMTRSRYRGPENPP